MSASSFRGFASLTLSNLAWNMFCLIYDIHHGVHKVRGAMLLNLAFVGLALYSSYYEVKPRIAGGLKARI